jgi:hypothetical protein
MIGSPFHEGNSGKKGRKLATHEWIEKGRVTFYERGYEVQIRRKDFLKTPWIKMGFEQDYRQSISGVDMQPILGNLASMPKPRLDIAKYLEGVRNYA